MSHHEAALQPAVLAGDTAAGRESVLIVMEELLGSQPRLARDAFLASSLVSLERATQDTRATGRLMTPPEAFELLTDGQRCVLRRRSTSADVVMPNVQCQALKSE